MASYYTVIQYIPDPIADERVNIGVIAFGDDGIYCRFLEDWGRVRRFSGKNPQFLRDFAERMVAAASRQEVMEMLPGTFRLTSERLRDMATRWENCIQFTEPCASLATSKELIAEIAGDYLREPSKRKREGRSRIDAAKLAAHEIHSVLESEIGREQAKHLFRRNYPIEGSLEEHAFDVAVANGRPFFVAQGLSFEVQDPNDLRRAVNSVKWILSDVHEVKDKIQVGVVALPPTSKAAQGMFTDAVKVFEKLGADVVSESNLGTWAEERTRELPEKLRKPKLKDGALVTA